MEAHFCLSNHRHFGVFCSVPDLILGLRKVRRVVRPSGKILLLEHMISPDLFLSAIMDSCQPARCANDGSQHQLSYPGNRDAAGFQIEKTEGLDKAGIFKFITA